MTDDESSDDSSGRSRTSRDASSESGSVASSRSSGSSDDSHSRDRHDSNAEIKKADKVFGRTSIVTGTMGYAKLSGASKATIDHIVRKRVNIIGRAGFDADCQIRSDAKLVSRRHAKLFWDGDADQWAIECLSEKNGMLVDGTPLVVGAPPLYLRSKNLIEMGDTAFFFLEAAEPTVRTSNIISTEALVLDLRMVRKKKRNSTQAASALNNQRKRSRPSPVPMSGYKRSGSKTKKKQRSVAADVETENSSDDDEPLRKDRSKEEDHLPVKEESPDFTAPIYGLKTVPSPGTADEDDSPVKSEDTPAKRPPAKRKLSGKKAGGTSAPPTRRKPLEPVESPARSADGEMSTPQKFRDQWNKKERGDFNRALFAIGVDDTLLRADPDSYDWSRFRGMAELAKKSDKQIVDYYERMMYDVESLLEEEEREKRTKGPRTKHKKGCICVVCRNTRKSRRKKREENNPTAEAADTGAPTAGTEDDEEGGVKSTGRTEDRLVGLVTAQKLRVRMGIHEAARQIHSEAGEAVIQKMGTQSRASVMGGTLPEWWITGRHDQALMVGTGMHGVAQWKAIWEDETIEEFADVKYELGDDMTWPSDQVAMKRLREIASSINAEIRRLNKKEARLSAVRAASGDAEGQGDTPRKEKRKSPAKGKKGGASGKSVGKTGANGKTKGKANAKKNSKSTAHRSVYNYADVGGAEAQTQSEGSESRGSSQGDHAAERDEENSGQGQDADEEEVEIEVEEEEEIEVEEEEEVEVEVMEYAEEAETGQQEGQAMETDDEDGDVDDDEEKVEYETASESGSD